MPEGIQDRVDQYHCVYYFRCACGNLHWVSYHQRTKPVFSVMCGANVVECDDLLILLPFSICRWTSLGHTWPNDEMSARASGTNLLVGLPIAFVSGLGVAVGLLDDQTSSLVGVAISASLLPPAVNSGILWIAFWFHGEDWLGGDNKEVAILPLEPLPEPRDNEIYPERGGRILVDGDDHKGIELQTHKDFRQAGLISLALTIANIALIIVSSMFMFRLKER